METRRAGKKPKKYINGIVLPIFYTICLILLFACLFLPFVSGDKDINGIQTLGGLFDNPYNPLSIFGKKGDFYKEFIQPVDLDPSDMFVSDVYRFIATLAAPILIIILIVTIVLVFVKVIKELKDKRVRAKVQGKFLLIFFLCLCIIGMLPGLRIARMESAEDFIDYFIKYFLSIQTYRLGKGLIAMTITSLILAFVPVAARLFIFAFTKRDLMLE